MNLTHTWNSWSTRTWTKLRITYSSDTYHKKRNNPICFTTPNEQTNTLPFTDKKGNITLISAARVQRRCRCAPETRKKSERNNNKKKQNFSIRTLIAIKQTPTHKSREICFAPHYYLTNESKFAKVLHLYLPRSTTGERSKAHTRFSLQPVVLSLHNQSSLPFRTN